MKTLEEKAEDYISDYGDGYAPKGIDVSQDPYTEERGFTLQDGKQIFIDGAEWALKHQWINVKDKLPDTENVVLASVNNTIDTVYYDGNDFMSMEGVRLLYVKYWMKIPECLLD